MSHCEMASESCSKTCETPCAKAKVETGLAQFFLKAFFNAIDVCFDDVYQEPKRILMVGGCRQRDFAQHIALLLPAADITLVDPNPEETKKAEEEICCRFKFVSAQLDELPFEDGYFDLVFAHNFFELAEVRNNHWKVAVRELFRVTVSEPERRGNVMLSYPRKNLWNLLRRLPGVESAFRLQGVAMPELLPSVHDMREVVGRTADVETVVKPWPWKILMTRQCGVVQVVEKLVLTAIGG